MNVLQDKRNGTAILALEGRLDSTTSGEFETRLLGVIESGETQLVLDFAKLDYISSAGLRVLLKAGKALKGKGGQMSFCSVKDYIREIFEMSGFTSFFRIHASLEDALKSS